jgi:hypothetical protein
MLEVLDDLPGRVIGVRATGHVTADDYRRVLVPAIDRALAEHDKVRLVYELGEDFAGYQAGAGWQDVRLGVTHFASFERVAIVTDVDWLRWTVPVVSVLIPGEVRAFPLAERDAAVAWAAG